MHANVVKVKIEDREQALKELHEMVVPRSSGAPGFVKGLWVDVGDDQGMAVIAYETEEAAKAVAEMARAQPPSGARIESIETREVLASA